MHVGMERNQYAMRRGSLPVLISFPSFILLVNLITMTWHVEIIGSVGNLWIIMIILGAHRNLGLDATCGCGKGSLPPPRIQ